MNAELEEKVRAKYALLTDEEILDLLVNRKWYATIFEGIKALYVTTSHQMTNRIVELVERYEEVAARASSRRSLASFISVSVAAPTRITATIFL